MNLLLLDRAEITDGHVLLDDRRAEHLRRVLKVEPGRAVSLGVLGGGVGKGEVVAVDGSAVKLAVGELEASPEQDYEVDLVVALPRPQTLHRVLQSAATMGVRRLDLVNAWRVEKSYFSSPVLKPLNLRRHLLLGAEQGMRTRLPELGVHHLLVPFLRDRLDGAAPKCRRIAHPEGGESFASALPSTVDELVVAIGPEGGWLDRELETFASLGFETVALGPWVLRVEAAVVAALAQIELVDGARRGKPEAG